MQSRNAIAGLIGPALGGGLYGHPARAPFRVQRRLLRRVRGARADAALRRRTARASTRHSRPARWSAPPPPSASCRCIPRTPSAQSSITPMAEPGCCAASPRSPCSHSPPGCCPASAPAPHDRPHSNDSSREQTGSVPRMGRFCPPKERFCPPKYLQTGPLPAGRLVSTLRVRRLLCSRVCRRSTAPRGQFSGSCSALARGGRLRRPSPISPAPPDPAERLSFPASAGSRATGRRRPRHAHRPPAPPRSLPPRRLVPRG